MLKFSKANSKLKALANVPELAQYLQNKRKVYSYDNGVSGWTCPGAKDCKAKVHIIEGRKKLIDGDDMQFRCFSATQEVMFPALYNQRQANFDYLKQFKTVDSMAQGILVSIPKNAGIIRINVAGDIFSQVYFDALLLTASSRPDILFYAYTKSLPFWIKRLGQVPANLVMTASWGGLYDDLIIPNSLRSARVVNHPSETTLTIDHTDECAANPKMRHQDFALLLHSQQAAGSEASKALKILKAEKIEFSYS